MSRINRRSPYSSVRSAAEHYWRIGLQPVPIATDLEGAPEIGSVPVSWSLEQIDRKFSESDNVGLILGPRSGDLVEVQFHWQEAGGWALDLMQGLPAFCRDGEGFVNRFARTRLRTGIVQFKIPDSLLDRFGADRQVVLELKGDGYQALVPPSVHPSGERLRWKGGYLALRYADDIPLVSSKWLIAKAGLLAAMAVLYRAHPRKCENTPDIFREITGMLLHAGCEIPLVSDFLDRLFFDALNWKWETRFEKAQAVKAQIDKGDRIGDVGTVCRLLGIDSMTETLRSWLDPFDEVFTKGRGDG